MAIHKMKMVGQLYGFETKKDHTLVDKWPMRLQLKPGQPGALEEFLNLRASRHAGTERYVEWKRTQL